jgi:fibronectin-binding autotransporter adhesin
MARLVMSRTSGYSARTRILLACTATTLGLLGHRAAADSSLTWDPTFSGSGTVGGSGTWDTGSTADWFNGSGDTTWTDTTGTDTAVFAGTGGTVVITGSGVTANALIFNSPGYSISGSTLTLAVAASEPTPTITANADVSFSSPITGSAGFIKAGSGTLILSGTDSQTGSITVSGGTLRYVDEAPDSSTSLSIAGGATLEFNVSTSPNAGDGANVALGPSGDVTVSGNGTFLKTGAGILALNGAGFGHDVAFDLGAGSLIDVEGGTLRNGGFGGGDWTHNMASLTIGSGGTFDAWDGNAVTVDALNGSGTLTHTSHGGTQIVTLGIAGGSGTFSGIVSDGAGGYALGITKVGAGTQVFAGNGVYSGATSINGGTLQFAGSSSLPVATAISLGAATLQVSDDGAGSNGIIDHTASSITLSTGTASDMISVGNNGGGSTGNTVAFGALSNGTPNSSQETTINFTGSNGYLLSFTSLSLSGGGGQGTTLNPTSTSVTITGNVTNPMNYSGGNNYDTIQLDGTSTENAIDGVISDSTIFTGTVNSGDTRLNKSNSSTWDLAGANTFHGPTNVYDGILELSNSLALQNTTLSDINGGAAIVFDSNVLSHAFTFGGISGGGTLALSDNASNPVALFIGNNGYTTTSSPNLTGSGSLTKIGDGTSTLTGQTSYTGGTVVSAGHLIFTNNQNANSNFVDNAILEFNTNNGTEALGNGTISGTGTLIKSGNNNLQFGYSGNVENISLSAGSLIDVQAGTLRNDYSNGNWAKNLASLQIESGATVDLWDSPGGITVDALNGSGSVQHTSYGGTEAFTVGVANGSGTFAGVITDTSGHALVFNKAGSGSQILSGASSYAGGTVVSAGTLQLNTSDTTPNVLPSAGAVTLAGGTLSVQNQNANGGNAITQNVGTLALAADSSDGIILGVPNGAAGSSLTATGFARGADSTLALNLTASGTGALTIGTALTQSNGVLGWAVVTDSGGTGFGTENGSNQIVRNTSTTQLVSTSNDSTANFTTTPTTDNDPGLPGGYNSSNNTLTLAINGGTPGVNSLAIDTSASSGTLDLNAGVLSISSGGLLMSGPNDYTIQNGTLSASELDLHQLGAGTLTITTGISNATGDVVKDGAGTVILAGAAGTSAQTGTTSIIQGTLRYVDNGPANTTAVSIASGATLEFNVSTTPNAGDGANVNFGPSNGTTVTGGGTFLKTGPGVLALHGQNGGNVNMNLSAGALIDVEGGTLRNGGYGGATWTNNKASLTIATGATVDIWDGGDLTVDALNGNGTLTHSNYGGSRPVTIGIAGGSGTFSGIISDTSANPLSLIKTGAGTETLTNSSNDYVGGTTINGGTLGAVGQALSTGAVTLAGGTLAVNDGVTPAAQALSTASQTWKGSSAYTARVFNDGSADLLSLTAAGSGTLTIDSSVTTSTPFTVNVTGAAGSLSATTSQDWVIANGITTLTGVTNPTPGNPTVVATAGAPAGASGFVLDMPAGLFTGNNNGFATTPVLEFEDNSGLYSLDVVYNDAPEPGTAVLALGALVPSILGRRWRKNQRVFHAHK